MTSTSNCYLLIKSNRRESSENSRRATNTWLISYHITDYSSFLVSHNHCLPFNQYHHETCTGSLCCDLEIQENWRRQTCVFSPIKYSELKFSRVYSFSCNSPLCVLISEISIEKQAVIPIACYSALGVKNFCRKCKDRNPSGKRRIPDEEVLSSTSRARHFNSKFWSIFVVWEICLFVFLFS